MTKHFSNYLFLYSLVALFIFTTSCSPTKDASFAEEDTLSRVVITPNETEIIPAIDDPIIDTLNGFYEGEYVAVRHGKEDWYMAQIIAFDGGKTNLRYVDNDTHSKDFVELMKLERIDVQKNDKVWALFEDGTSFRKAVVQGIEQDYISVKFEKYGDGKIHFLQIFKEK